VYSISGPDGTYPLDGQGSFDGQPVGAVGDASAVMAFPAPTNLVAVPANRTLYLAWPKMTNASGYNIHYWADGASGQPMVQDAGVPSGEYYPLQNLTNNTLYFICVAAYDANRNESPRSEVVTAVPSQSAGSLGAVTWNQHYYNPTSEVAIVTLTDADPNTDPNAVETVTVRITSYSDTLGFDLTLAETATNSGIFTSAANGTNVGFTFGNSDVLNKLIRVVPGDVLTARYADVLPPIPTTATAFVALSGVLRPILSGPTMVAGGLFRFIVSPDANLPSLRIQSSTDLVNWETLTSLLNPSGPIVIGDPEAVSHPARFYRAVSP
jgi:hypothetical protein